MKLEKIGDSILVNEDCLKVLKSFPSDFIDLVITSPPYDDLRNYNSAIDYNEVVSELFRVVKRGGVVAWNVNDRIINGSKTLTSFKQAILFNEKGFNVNDVMIWKKTNPMPQVKQPRYNQCFEYMFVFSKGKPKSFNPIMTPCKSKGMDYKSTCKKITKDKQRNYKEFVINNEKVSDNIFEFAVAQNKTSHPAVFPLQLPEIHIKSWSNENDLVYDPFSGSFTTGVACQNLKRRFVGSELSVNYFDEGVKRMKENLERLNNGNIQT